MLFVSSGLPAIERLQKEGITLSTNTPPDNVLRIGVYNLMPIKIETETDLLRAFSESPLNIQFIWLNPQGHISKNTPLAHIHKFYKTADKETLNALDGLIITGAPLERIKFEDVDYWNEYASILNYCHSKNKPVLLLCWAAFAALHHHFNLNTILHTKKLSGVFSHNIIEPTHHLLTNIINPFYAPQSRFITIDVTEAEAKGFKVLAHNSIAGMHVGVWKNETYITGHGEYQINTLLNEYNRDSAKGMNPELPVNYLDIEGKPIERWQKNGRILFNNWITSVLSVP